MASPLPKCFDCNAVPIMLHINTPNHGLMYSGACPECKFFNAPSHTKEGARSAWYRTNKYGQSEHEIKLRRERQRLIKEEPFPGEVAETTPLEKQD